jgi:hypothetical protein
MVVKQAGVVVVLLVVACSGAVEAGTNIGEEHIEAIIDRLATIQAQKIELEKAEQHLLILLKEKLGQQKVRLNKLGINIEYGDLPRRKPLLPNRQAVARCLPAYLKLSTVIYADYGGRNPITLEQKLAEVGAQVRPDGKVADANGKEIYFYHTPRSGCPLHPEQLDSYQKLQRRYRVIDIDDHPGAPPPP